MTDMYFSKLVLLAVKEIRALSEADGYYCTYPYSGRLDRFGWRSLQCVGHYAESLGRCRLHGGR